MTDPHYLFGDNSHAAQRLHLLARVYHESTRAFLSKAAGSIHFSLAVDLGCGPGLTTRLIGDTLGCDRVIGLDSSKAFIQLARANAGNRLSFFEHDVSAIPFPGGPANLIFARFLLSHLHNPEVVVANWATQLDRRGFLLLEETEAIHTGDAVFARYLIVVESMLAGHSNHLYAGHVVAGLDCPSLSPVFSDLRRVDVRDCDAARMFVLNLRTWKENEFIRSNYSTNSILELEQALRGIGDNDRCARTIAWDVRQAVWLKD